jgi:hypothetical protein
MHRLPPGSEEAQRVKAIRGAAHGTSLFRLGPTSITLVLVIEAINRCIIEWEHRLREYKESYRDQDLPGGVTQTTAFDQTTDSPS